MCVSRAGKSATPWMSHVHSVPSSTAPVDSRLRLLYGVSPSHMWASSFLLPPVFPIIHWTHDPRAALGAFIPEEWQLMSTHVCGKNPYTIIHSSFICSRQKRGETQVSSSEWIAQPTIVLPCCGLLHSNKKERTYCYTQQPGWLSRALCWVEKSQSPKVACCISPFIWQAWNDKKLQRWSSGWWGERGVIKGDTWVRSQGWNSPESWWQWWLHESTPVMKWHRTMCTHVCQGQFPGFDSMLWFHKNFDITRTCVRVKPWGKLSGEYTGLLCAIFESSCDL